MNRKTLAIPVIVLVCTIAAVVAYLVLTSRNLSPPATATYGSSGLNIKVDYCRPSKRGRVIFGEETEGALQPYGQYWRLGANDATKITFDKDITFAGQPVKAGTYRMYAFPNIPAWTIVLNGEFETYAADLPDDSRDVVRVEVPVEEVASVTEMFTITFDGEATDVNMHLAWDKANVRVPIGVQ